MAAAGADTAVAVATATERGRKTLVLQEGMCTVRAKRTGTKKGAVTKTLNGGPVNKEVSS